MEEANTPNLIDKIIELRLDRHTNVSELNKKDLQEILVEFIGNIKITDIRNLIQNSIATSFNNKNVQFDLPKFKVSDVEKVNIDAFNYIKILLNGVDFAFYFFLKLALIVIEKDSVDYRNLHDNDIKDAHQYAIRNTITTEQKMEDFDKYVKEFYDKQIDVVQDAIKGVLRGRVEYYKSKKIKDISDFTETVDKYKEVKKNTEDPTAQIVSHILTAIELAQSNTIDEKGIYEFLEHILKITSPITPSIANAQIGSNVAGGSGWLLGKGFKKHISNLQKVSTKNIQKDLIKILHNTKGITLAKIRKQLQKLTSNKMKVGGFESANVVSARNTSQSTPTSSVPIYEHPSSSSRPNLQRAPATSVFVRHGNNTDEPNSGAKKQKEEELTKAFQKFDLGEDAEYKDVVNKFFELYNNALNSEKLDENQNITGVINAYTKILNNFKELANKRGDTTTEYESAQYLINRHETGKYNEILLLDFFKDMQIKCKDNTYKLVHVVYNVEKPSVVSANKDPDIKCIYDILEPPTVLTNFEKIPDRSPEILARQQEALRKIAEEIARVEAEKTEKEGQIALLNKEKAALQETLNAKEQQLQKLNDNTAQTEETRQHLKNSTEELERLKKELETATEKERTAQTETDNLSGILIKIAVEQEILKNDLDITRNALAKATDQPFGHAIANGFSSVANVATKLATTLRTNGGGGSTPETTITDDIENTRKLSSNIQNIDNILKEIKNDWDTYKTTVPPKEFKDPLFNTYLDKVKEFVNVQGDKDIFNTPSYVNNQSYKVKSEDSSKNIGNIDELLKSISTFTKIDNTEITLSIDNIKTLATKYVEDAKSFKNNLNTLIKYIGASTLKTIQNIDKDTIETFLNTPDNIYNKEPTIKNEIKEYLKAIETKFSEISAHAYTDADIAKMNAYFQSESGGKLISRMTDKFDKATKETEYITKTLIDYCKKYSSANKHIETEILEKLQPKIMKSEKHFIDLVGILNDTKLKIIFDINTSLNNIQSRQKKSGGAKQIGGAEQETISEKIEANRKDVDNRLDKPITEELQKLKSLYEDLFNTFTKMGNPTNASILASNNYESLFNTIFNKYVENKKADKGEYVASKQLIESLKVNHLIPEEVLKVDLRDKLVFIFATLFMRLFALALVEYMINKNTLNRLDTVVVVFLIIFTVLFLLLVAIVNLDEYKLRIIFNYINLHTGGLNILIYLAIVWAFGGLIYFVMYKINGEVVLTAENDEGRARLKYKIEVISMIVWVYATMVVLVLP